MKKILFLAVTAAAVLASSTSLAQNSLKAINTGGQAGAYHNTFCPPIPGVLANAYFQGYQCTTSAGTIQNIERVLKTPTNIGFAQLDVYAREASVRQAEFEKLQLIRTDIACEGLWMVTKNPDLNFGQVLALARRIQWILPAKASGSTASFNYLRSVDPEGLGRINDSNITYLNDAGAMLRSIISSTRGEVGFFVQFADPRNANIKLMVENNLNIIPVISREILRAKVDDQHVYQAQQFRLAEGGLFGIGGRAQTATTACTPVALFTGSPAAFTDRNSQDDAKEMIDRLRQIPSKNLLPKDNTIASLITGATRLSQAAVDQAVSGVESARKAIENR